MNSKERMGYQMKMSIGALLVLAACTGMTRADGLTSGTTTNATTIEASTVLMPGRYSASVAPTFNTAMASRLEMAVKKIQGLDSVTTNISDSSIHYSVLKGSHVREADIRKVVGDTFPGAVLTTPVLEHSMSANPGL